MEILKKELRQEARPLLLWIFCVGFLVIGGMVKFSGLSSAAGPGVGDMLAMLPRAVLAFFGMAEADIETLGGFYSVLQMYAAVAASCYAVHLGTMSVLRESFDRTYEFLFAKPCGRLHILTVKLCSGLICLTLLCAFNCLFSYIAPGLYGLENTITEVIPLFSLALYVVVLFFFFFSAMLSALLLSGELAVRLSNAFILVEYFLSVAFDMSEKAGFLRCLTVFKFFRAGELLDGNLSGGSLAAALILSTLFALVTAAAFKRRDLTAV